MTYNARSVQYISKKMLLDEKLEISALFKNKFIIKIIISREERAICEALRTLEFFLSVVRNPKNRSWRG